MPQAIRIYEHGGPEVMRLEPMDPGPVGARQVRIRQTAIGVNFIDTYHRSGLYPMALPGVLGREAAGVVMEAGRSVTAFKPGDGVRIGSSNPPSVPACSRNGPYGEPQ
jgi:NADPH2:quinone reductase